MSAEPRSWQDRDSLIPVIPTDDERERQQARQATAAGYRELPLGPVSARSWLEREAKTVDIETLRQAAKLNPREDMRAAAVIELRRRGADEAPDRLRVITWPNIMAEPDAPAVMIRPGVPQVGVTVAAGAPKTGKTLLMGQWALESKRTTLMIIEEGSLAALSYRLRTQAAALGVTDPPISLMHRQRIRLDDPAFVTTLRDEIDWGEYELVIVDPLNRAHSADENRPTEMTRVMDGLGEIAYRLNIAVVAIHHLAKPSAERRGDPWDRFRGASSIRSGTDANLIMEAAGDRVHLIGEFRDAEPLSEWLELDRDTLTFRSAEAPEAPAKIDALALRAFVEARSQVNGQQVIEEFKVSKNTAFAALRALGCDEYPGHRGRLTFSLGTGQ